MSVAQFPPVLVRSRDGSARGHGSSNPVFPLLLQCGAGNLRPAMTPRRKPRRPTGQSPAPEKTRRKPRRSRPRAVRGARTARSAPGHRACRGPRRRRTAPKPQGNRCPRARTLQPAKRRCRIRPSKKPAAKPRKPPIVESHEYREPRESEPRGEQVEPVPSVASLAISNPRTPAAVTEAIRRRHADYCLPPASAGSTGRGPGDPGIGPEVQKDSGRTGNWTRCAAHCANSIAVLLVPEHEGPAPRSTASP